MLSFATPTWQTAILAQNTTKGPLGSGKARMANLIVPRVYLSDYFTATDERELGRLGITHIVTVLDRQPAIPDCIPQEHRLLVSLADRSDADIISHLDQTTEFITAALAENEENNVLVHCFQGISRSATVVAAYLVSTSTMTASESIAYLQAKRSCRVSKHGLP
ncbi:protein-tyrosine phosphatase-like protein [Roridomyces roridus]|uniref:Protein-tyrosine phosphatase-like protein n=1 Tax=Roridomyces roridus TaxID=1738132 RepID=A0AAD7BK75_9AGAR|nr:protein-tyrosine phosphatase-like protein [Roridomyces roridus]